MALWAYKTKCPMAFSVYFLRMSHAIHDGQFNPDEFLNYFLGMHLWIDFIRMHDQLAGKGLPILVYLGIEQSQVD